MYIWPERLQTGSSPSSSEESVFINTKDMNNNYLTIETEDSFSTLLELAANNDLEGFKKSIKHDASSIDEIGLWYGRQKGSNQMVLEHRTPLMVSATYGSLDVLKLILSLSEADVNRSCGPDKSTALHCAASGGSVNSIDTVKLLLQAGSNPDLLDANGRRPSDVIIVSPKLPSVKIALEELLKNDFDGSNNSISPPFSSSPDSESPLSASDSTSSPTKFSEIPISSILSDKKEYPIDPSFPDIKNSIYGTDEFRMFSFKVRPCSRAYSHDWTECPFVHPGENARRRDPRKFHYSCVPCPEFRKGTCRRGDMCEYAHGVFECWLHPAQYRTKLCKDGISCARRVCFFAHKTEELRPLYVSTGSAAPSPLSPSMMSLLPGSPSSVSVMSPSPFTPPMSPSSNGISHSSLAWPQPNVPTLHLPVNNIQSSRLRSSSNARDIHVEDFNMFPDFVNLHGRTTKTLTPSNLEDLFTAEISSSPRYSDQSAASAIFSPSHKSSVLNQFQQYNKSVFSPKNIEHHILQASFGMPSPGRMSPQYAEPISPSFFTHREKQQQYQFRSLSSRNLGSNNGGVVGSPVSSLSQWGSPNGKLDWAVHGDELGQLRRSSSFELGNNGEEPDFSWVQSLVKESPPEVKEKLAVSSSAMSSSGENSNSNSQIEAIDHSVLGAWIEQFQLDQLVSQ